MTYSASSSTATSSSSVSSSSPSSCHTLSRFRHHFTHPHCPHSSSTAHTHRATKASDLACLLDPSYRPSSSQESAMRQVYVDHAGETHDPDYRLFNYPSPKRRERDLHWSDPEEDELAWYEEQQQRQERTRRASFEDQWSSLYRPGSRASDPTYDNYAYAYPSASPSSSFSSSPITFASRGYTSDEEIPSTTRTTTRHKKLRRRRASLTVDVDDDNYDALAVEAHADYSDALDASLSLSPPPSPTSSAQYTFRRSWHALALRTQVAAYRAKKRMQGLVGRANTF